MCCFAAAAVFIGARFGAFIWWIFDRGRWSEAFDSFWIGFLGWIFVPWLTLAWVLVFPGGVRGFDWVILAIGIAIDISSYSSGGYARGRQYA